MVKYKIDTYFRYDNTVDIHPQLSPGIILMSGGVHDGGILQSQLFTSRSQNQVSGKLRSSGFWSLSKFFK